ncbi:MAG: hypothetical protein HUU55_10135 [Myxococcales bacterium]|nr:hypothetical protein [Myxococcales bacterium]
MQTDRIDSKREFDAASWPETWKACVVFIRELLAVKNQVKTEEIPEADAEQFFWTKMLKKPHDGTGQRTQLAHKRKRRSEIAAGSVGGWVWAAVQRIFALGEKIGKTAFVTGGVAKDSRANYLKIKRSALAAALGLVPNVELWMNRIEAAARIFEECCENVKTKTSRKGATKRPKPRHGVRRDVVLGWLRKHRRLHRKGDAVFIRIRMGEISEHVRRWIQHGDVEHVSNAEPMLSHYLHVFEQHDLRVEMATAAAAGRNERHHDPRAAAEKAHALIEGLGWEWMRAKEFGKLYELVLTKDIRLGLLDTVEKLAQKTSDFTALRLVEVSRGVWWRLRAVVAQMQGMSGTKVLTWLNRALTHVVKAGHESLALSILGDMATAQAKMGLVKEAMITIENANELALAHGNDRRRFRLLCIGAELAHQLNHPGYAMMQFRQAQMIFDGLQTADPKLLSDGVPKVWYQQSFQKELDRVAEVLAKDVIKTPVTLESITGMKMDERLIMGIEDDEED